MEEITQGIEEISITTYEKGSVHDVDVTFIVDPQNFYVRPRKYVEILRKIESTAPTIKFTFEDVKELVVYKCAYPDGIVRYIRGWVYNACLTDNTMLCDIYTVDYGHVQRSVLIEHIWKCNHIYANISPLATICQLGNCFPIQHSIDHKGFNQRAIAEFKNFVLNEPATIQVLGKITRKLIVSMVNSRSLDIATLMAIGLFSRVGHVRSQIPWKPIITVYRGEFKFKELQIDQTLYVRMQSGTSLDNFHVAAVSDYNNHVKETEFISFYARGEFVINEQDIKEGILTCVKEVNGSMYERAFIKSVNNEDKTALVKLVDKGRDEIVDFNRFKYMPAVCLRTPVVSIYCSAGDSKFWGDSLETFLTPGFKFLIKIKKLGRGFDCPNTVEIRPLKTCRQRNNNTRQARVT